VGNAESEKRVKQVLPRLLLSLSKRDRRVLDVGSGGGVYSLELARTGRTVVGIDIDPIMVRIAKVALEDCRGAPQVLVGDGLMMPFHRRSFDAAVLLGNSLSHFGYDAMSALCVEVEAVLRPSGRWIIEYEDLFEYGLRGLLRPNLRFKRSLKDPARWEVSETPPAPCDGKKVGGLRASDEHCRRIREGRTATEGSRFDIAISYCDYDPGEARITYRVEELGTGKTWDTPNYVWTPRTLRLLLSSAGFRCRRASRLSGGTFLDVFVPDGSRPGGRT
jgi:SAM-dependent methyltransferase